MRLAPVDDDRQQPLPRRPAPDDVDQIAAVETASVPPLYGLIRTL